MDKDFEENIADYQICEQCNEPVSEQARFCPHCGHLLHQEPDDDSTRNYWLKLMTFFYGIQFLICAIFNFTESFQTLRGFLIADAILGGFTMVFAFVMRDELLPLLKWNNFSFLKVLMYALVAIIAAIIVNYTVTWLNRSIFDREIFFYSTFRHLAYPKLTMLLVIALQPAIMEELAFRGVLQQGLLKFIEPRQVIYITAFLFAIIHMSFISFFWLVPFAIWLGRVRMKENTLWYGVIIHFCFNATACLFEFYELGLLRW